MYQIHNLVSSTILVVAYIFQQQLGIFLNIVGIIDYYPSEVTPNSHIIFSDVENGTVDDIEMMFKLEKPFVVRNYLNTYKYDLSYFRTIKNNTKIPVFTLEHEDRSVKMMDSEEYFNTFTDSSKYLYTRCMKDSFPTEAYFNTSDIFGRMGLINELTFSQFVDKNPMHCFFIGSTHTGSRVHSDFTSSVFLQLHGRKEWTFFDPSYTYNLQPRGQPNNIAYNSGLDFNSSKLPNLAGLKTILKPGDLLIFPSFWWHGVKNLDKVSIGMDTPVVDLFGSIFRNPLLTAGTVLNPRFLFKVFKSIVFTSGGVTEVFFDNYKL